MHLTHRVGVTAAVEADKVGVEVPCVANSHCDGGANLELLPQEDCVKLPLFIIAMTNYLKHCRTDGHHHLALMNKDIIDVHCYIV